MKKIIFILLASVNIQVFSQEIVHSIEEVTNKELFSIRTFLKTEKKIIVAYEYIIDKNQIRLAENEYINKYEYDLKSIKKGDYFYLLKISIGIKNDIIVRTSLVKCTKKSRRNWIYTHFYDITNEYLLDNKREK